MTDICRPWRRAVAAVRAPSLTLHNHMHETERTRTMTEQSAPGPTCPRCRSGNVSDYDRDLATFACEDCGCRPFGLAALEVSAFLADLRVTADTNTED